MEKKNFVSTKGKFESVETEEARAEAFVPPKLPVDIELDLELVKILDSARGNLGRLYSMSEDLKNPSLYYGPALIQEAASSSRIEGTRTTMEKIFEKEIELEEKEIDPEERELRDPEDVVAALEEGIEYGLDRIEVQPLNLELVKRIHEKVFTGADMNPGRFRDKPVWIGPGGAGIDQAHYVPPPAEEIEPLLENLIEYLNSPDADDMPILIKIAIAHYQFEAIHPFEDGNGRIGRLLVLLNMCDDDIFPKEPLLTGPFINLSNYFLRNRQQYYDRLMNVSSNGEYTEWVKFFLRAVDKQSQHAINTLEEVESLRDDFKKDVDEKGVPEVAQDAVDELFRNPIITIPKVEKEFGVSYQTANSAIHALEKKGILEEMKPNRRPKKFVCRKILDIVYSDFEWTI